MEGSSLKHFNFQKYTPQQIIDKYESVLAGREEQITLLSLEMGQLNDRLTTFQEENTTLLEENASLKLKLSKKESLLSQELNNKEIMFIRLEKKEKEYDLLKKQYDILLKSLEGKTIIATKSQKTEYVSTPVVVEKEVNSSSSNNSSNNEMNVNPNNPFNDVVDGEEKGKESEGNGSKQNEDKDKQVKMSARDKIKELKAKTGNVTKLNFSQILQAKKDAASKKDNKEDKQEKDKEKDNNKDNQGEIASTQVNQDNVVENKEENTQ